MTDREDILTWAVITVVCLLSVLVTIWMYSRVDIMAGELPPAASEATMLTYEVVYQHEIGEPFVTETLHIRRATVEEFPPWLGLSYLFSVRLIEWE